MVTSNGEVHVWHQCHACRLEPIVGRRHECRTCPAGPDTVLCETCYQRLQFAEIKHPNGGPTRGRPHEFVPVDGTPADAFDAWLNVRDREAPSPHVPDACAVRPAFISGSSVFMGSYSFFAECGDGVPVLLTALHVLDELAKRKGIDCSPRNASYTGRELPPEIDCVKLYNVFVANWIGAVTGYAGPMLALPLARAGDIEPDSHRDIAAFKVFFLPARQPLRLAGSRPAVGDPVWLVATVRGRDSRTVSATVVESTERTLVYRFSRNAPAAALRFTSGAPILDRRGEVAGINVGGGVLAGRRFGHACHSDNIRCQLSERPVTQRIRSSINIPFGR